MSENRKTTAPIPVVGAAGEQSSGRETISIIPKESVERNRRNGSLATVSMTELYDTAYPPKAVLIENLLYAGTYLFVGAPKIGKPPLFVAWNRSVSRSCHWRRRKTAKVFSRPQF